MTEPVDLGRVVRHRRAPGWEPARDEGEQCRICGLYLRSGLLGMPQPLLPGDIPARREVCDGCAARGSFPAEPYTPAWA